ncbi:MAG TPA: nucleotidyltransferase domain-containing protein, partial [Ktedonobacteraceae bacterium]|nr:nucleotidyltransferase domain-containing protein [Ktedonobacteraceae bacterium]
MKEILLQGTLGYAQIDSIVKEVVQVYEDTFPGEIAAYYVEGSYADHTSLATSDIDLVIVFRHAFAHRETRTMAERTWTSEPKGAPEVDLTVVDEESLRAGVHPTLKLGSRLIYGQDVCDLYPLVPIEAWARERMHAAYWLLVTIYQRSTPVHLPLTLPSPLEEFYGYTNRTLQLPDGQEVFCTRNLIRT